MRLLEQTKLKKQKFFGSFFQKRTSSFPCYVFGRPVSKMQGGFGGGAAFYGERAGRVGECGPRRVDQVGDSGAGEACDGAEHGGGFGEAERAGGGEEIRL